MDPSDNKNLNRETKEYIKEKVSQKVEEKIGETIEQTQQQMSEQIKGELGKEVSRQVSRRIEKIMGDGFLKMQQGIQKYRLIYGVFVVMGFLLFWYGAWQIIPLIPILREGVVALLIGFLLLIVSGALYYKLVGFSSK